MKKTIPISEVMTPAPSSIASDLSVNVAHQRMRNLGVRHLLVMRQGRIVGVVSDAELIAAIAAQSINKSFTVGDVASSELYVVLPTAPLEEVAEQMAERRHSCTVIQDSDGEPVGIFTTVDACRILAQQLRQRIVRKEPCAVEA